MDLMGPWAGYTRVAVRCRDYLVTGRCQSTLALQAINKPLYSGEPISGQARTAAQKTSGGLLVVRSLRSV